MKTKETKQKSITQQLRDVRDKLSAEIKDMTNEQLKEYLERQKTLHSKKTWRKHAESKK